MIHVATGEVALTLEGHTGRVTGALVNPSNSLQLITCSLDGTCTLQFINIVFLDKLTCFALQCASGIWMMVFV